MRFYCSDDTVDLEQYPYHVRDVHISDPFILADPKSRCYYTYVQFADTERFPDVETDKEHGVFYVLESKDLIHWSKPQICFRQNNFWADKDYWAPEVHIWKGRYYLFISFRADGHYRKCQCLVSDSPKGPFEPIRQEAVTPDGWQSLDGTLYVDRSGKPWMVFCHEWLQVGDGQICAIPMSDDLGEAIGDPVILFRASDGKWNAKGAKEGGYVTDGPFLHRLPGGKLIMLWSSFTEKGAYAVGYATSRFGDILGPWDQELEPLYALDGGHAMLFYTFGGQLMMACHCPNDHPKKRILLFEMEEDENGLHVVNEVTGNWFHAAGGPAKGWVYEKPCVEIPSFAKDPRG